MNLKLAQNFKQILPKLSNELHKGQSGRIAIVGGSKEYSGAPYFSAISALRVGADLAHVFTTSDAAPIIKSYSPDFIVLPLIDAENSELEIRTWINKMHVLVIGPGLGRSEAAFKAARTALNSAKIIDLPIVIDADGLFLLNQDPALIRGYHKCTITPNFMEFKRLYEAIFTSEEYEESKGFASLEAQCEAVRKLANSLENITILKKGHVDIISNGHEVVHAGGEGSLKRCGGVGDLLTGILATFTFWTHQAPHATASPPGIMAAYAAASFTRECAHIAFLKHHRALLASDIVEQIGPAFRHTFDV